MKGRQYCGKDTEMEGEGGDSLTPTWRHVSFYEAHRIRDSSDFAASPSAFRNPNEIAAVCSCTKLPRFISELQDSQQNGSASTSSPQKLDCTLVGDSKGRIKVLDSAGYHELGSWQAFHGAPQSINGTQRVTHISCDDKGRVITLGEDEGARFPIIRIWDLRTVARSINKKGTAPQLLAEGKVQHGSKPFPVASLAHTTSLSFLSIGLVDGSVLLLRALDDALKSASRNPETFSDISPAVALPKFKVAFQPNSGKSESVSTLHEPITGLGFAEVQRSNISEKALGKRALNGNSQPAYKAREPKKVEKSSSPETVTLFIVTLTRVLRYIVSGKGAGSPASVIDDVGCALGCAKLIPQGKGIQSLTSLDGKMVIARDEAVYIIGTEGREMSLAYEGLKSSIRLASTQLVIISPPVTPSADANPVTTRQHISGKDRKTGRLESPRNRDKPLTEAVKVTIFDLDNKLVVYSNTFEGGVRDAWTAIDGDVVILGDDGALTQLQEKTLRQKLDLLFKKSLYLLAINVAKSHAARSSTDVDHMGTQLGEIYCKYADSLYEKGDFEGAMSQYVKTIGYTQPSYVIRKFLDAQRITNLTTYLQELHNRGLANSDHTTLLLNCFTKLKDVASLDRFIKRPIATSTSVDERDSTIDEDEFSIEARRELPFDLDTAIRVCRQAGYHEHAAYLARRYDQHDEYIRIQIEDVHEYEVALNYIRGLSAKEAEQNLLRYGKVLLDQIPTQTTALLIEVCSGAFHPMPVAIGAGVDASKIQGKSAAAQYLSYLQVGGFGKSSSPVIAQGLTERSSTPATSTVLKGDDATIGSQNGIKINGEEVEPAIDAYAVPSCQVFFSHFINHHDSFIQFLETVALARWDQIIDDVKETITPLAEISTNSFESVDPYLYPDKKEQTSIWNTLLELYLMQATAISSKREKIVIDHTQEDQEARKRKALQLLRQYKQLPYDVSHALMVCSQEDFDEGVVFLYERMGMYEDILRLYMAKMTADPNEKRSTDLMQCLDRYGESAPQIYPMLLQYMVSSEKLLSMYSKELESILLYIEEERLMSPLEVVQMLSKKGIASVGLIRSYLIRSIQSQQADMETNSKLGKTYREETEEKLREIESLKDLSQPKIFQQTKCNACRGTLDLPIVHFMCKHSFHSRCLGEEEKECPLCAKSHGVILEIRKNNLAFGERQDL